MSSAQQSPRQPATPSDMAEELIRMRAQVARYRMAFALSAPGQALVDLGGRFIEVNDSLSHLLGYSAKELVGKRFHDITHPDDLDDDDRSMADMVAGRFGNYLRDKRYLRPDGAIVHAVLQACESFDVSTVQQNALPTLRCHRLARQAALEMSSPHHTVI